MYVAGVEIGGFGMCRENVGDNPKYGEIGREN